MNASDKNALARLAGRGNASKAAGTDDLQGLLLQVVFALLMIFMIAYFIFVESTKRERENDLMQLNHQKLVLAIEKVAEEHRVKYGLNALMTQGTDGKRSFDADEHVQNGAIVLAPAAKAAFSSGSSAANRDYKDVAALKAGWRDEVLAAAELTDDDIVESEQDWLGEEIAKAVEDVRLDARGVQRALAARLQLSWIEHPETIPNFESSEDNVKFAAGLAERLKEESLRRVAEESGVEILP